MLKTRLSTAAIALPTLLAIVIFAPAWFFTAFILVLGVWGLYEVSETTHAHTAGSIAIIVLIGLAPMLFTLLDDDPAWIVPLTVVVIVLAVVAVVAIGGASRGPKGVLLTVIGAAWVGVLFPYFAILRNRAGGVSAILMMLLLVIASDAGAYFGGSYAGRHRLAPNLSPHKTIEGAIAGLLAAIVAALALRPLLAAEWGMGEASVFGAAVAVLAQLGDMAGSAIKRSAEVKDFGWIFPGHGGLLDRTCSLVFACVFTYYYVK